MITVNTDGAFYHEGKLVSKEEMKSFAGAQGKKPQNIASSILAAHNSSNDPSKLKIKFDGIMSHDITYVSIIQTARASGMTKFPVPVALTNCHNSLCAIGGTINADDHRFGLSAAKKYGGDFVPANMAVIHQYAREMMAGSGKMIIGSDSHTRYGAIGCMAVGEGGGELVKQLLGHTWDVDTPEVIAIYLTGKLRPGVGPHDVAIALIGAVFDKKIVKNKILEFVGPGVATLSMDYRLGIDVMTTETACLSSVWQTDEVVHDFLETHGRGNAYKQLTPDEGAWYDKVVHVDLSTIEPMIAMPFHPKNAYSIAEFNANAEDILASIEKEAAGLLGEKYASVPNLRSKLINGKFHVDQGEVAGCCGGLFENLHTMAAMLKGKSIGSNGFTLTVYPASQPVLQELLRIGDIASLVAAGATIRTSFCGPCFGAGEIPPQNGFSIRHVTRNFPNREGSRPPEGQIAYVALMDARSIAATAMNGGVLTAAGEDAVAPAHKYVFNPEIYKNCVSHSQGAPAPDTKLVTGPNIADWPEMFGMPEDLLIKVAATLRDPVTTTDDFIASGEPSAFRSNPGRMAEYTLQRKDPEYVGRAKACRSLEQARQAAVKAGAALPAEVADLFAQAGLSAADAKTTGIGSVVYAVYPGDGSAREQAASCQKVLGAWANIAGNYATKRYRSNLINWGILPFIIDDVENTDVQIGDVIYVKGIRQLLEGDGEEIKAVRYRDGQALPLTLKLPGMSRSERAILLAGSLINSYKG